MLYLTEEYAVATESTNAAQEQKGTILFIVC